MSEAIKAYESIISTSPDFKEIERLRAKAAIFEAHALAGAEERGEERAAKKWQSVVEKKDAELANKDTELANKEARIAELEGALRDSKK